MFKKFFKYTLFLTLLIGSLFLCGYGYSKLSNKLEIKSANNISMYDNANEVFFKVMELVNGLI